MQATCTNCQVNFEYVTSCNGRYCSNTCQQAYQYKERIVAWKSGELLGWSGKTANLAPWLRRYMLAKTGACCQVCGWGEIHPVDGRPLVEIDHIDGDAHNCSEENLRVLCPNCHSMTPTFRARNKRSKRVR